MTSWPHDEPRMTPLPHPLDGWHKLKSSSTAGNVRLNMLFPRVWEAARFTLVDLHSFTAGQKRTIFGNFVSITNNSVWIIFTVAQLGHLICWTQLINYMIQNMLTSVRWAGSSNVSDVKHHMGQSAVITLFTRVLCCSAFEINKLINYWTERSHPSEIALCTRSSSPMWQVINCNVSG